MSKETWRENKTQLSGTESSDNEEKFKEVSEDFETNEKRRSDTRTPDGGTNSQQGDTTGRSQPTPISTINYLQHFDSKFSFNKETPKQDKDNMEMITLSSVLSDSTKSRIARYRLEIIAQNNEDDSAGFDKELIQIKRTLRELKLKYNDKLTELKTKLIGVVNKENVEEHMELFRNAEQLLIHYGEDIAQMKEELKRSEEGTRIMVDSVKCHEYRENLYDEERKVRATDPRNVQAAIQRYKQGDDINAFLTKVNNYAAMNGLGTEDVKKILEYLLEDRPYQKFTNNRERPIQEIFDSLNTAFGKMKPGLSNWKEMVNITRKSNESLLQLMMRYEELWEDMAHKSKIEIGTTRKTLNTVTMLQNNINGEAKRHMNQEMSKIDMSGWTTNKIHDWCKGMTNILNQIESTHKEGFYDIDGKNVQYNALSFVKGERDKRDKNKKNHRTQEKFEERRRNRSISVDSKRFADSDNTKHYQRPNRQKGEYDSKNKKDFHRGNQNRNQRSNFSDNFEHRGRQRQRENHYRDERYRNNSMENYKNNRKRTHEDYNREFRKQTGNRSFGYDWKPNPPVMQVCSECKDHYKFNIPDQYFRVSNQAQCHINHEKRRYKKKPSVHYNNIGADEIDAEAKFLEEEDGEISDDGEIE